MSEEKQEYDAETPQPETAPEWKVVRWYEGLWHHPDWHEPTAEELEAFDKLWSEILGY